MKKVFYYFSLLLIVAFIFGCSNKIPKKMKLGGVEYDSEFVRSGYYFDRASFSDATLAGMLEKVEVIEKPKSLGEMELPDFSSFLLTYYITPNITDDDVENEINSEIQSETEYVPVKVKREAHMTDRVTIDYKGYVNGKAFDGGESKDYILVLGSNAFIPGFEENVAGHFAGKQFTINVTFPKNYDKSLAGKEATFDITIKNIEEAVSPVFNEKFVKEHSKIGSKTIDEYKTEVLKRIEGRNEFSKNQDLIFQLFDKLINDGKFYPTDLALAWQFSTIINQIKYEAEFSNSTLTNFIINSGYSAIDAYKEIKTGASELIKQQMVYDFIIDKYKVNITEAEVKEWVANTTSFNGYEMPYDEYIKYMGKDFVYDGAKQYKALTYALKDCHVVYEDVEINDESIN